MGPFTSLGASIENILITQGNLAVAYERLGRFEAALRLKQDVYSGRLRLNGEEHENSLIAANNYAWGLLKLRRFEEAKALMRKTMRVARRILGESNDLMFMMRWAYAESLYKDADATLDDLREAVTTLEDTALIARRVLGGAHPTTRGIEVALRDARAALRARETGDVSSIREAVEATPPTSKSQN